MSVWSILLRLFLAAALIFNGAAAVASVHMHHMGGVPATTQPEPASAEEHPCHEHASTAADQPAPAVDADTRSPDCCKSGNCRCGCVHQATAAVLGLHPVASTIEHAASARPMSTGHAGPALPHLIRPPIG